MFVITDIVSKSNAVDEVWVAEVAVAVTDVQQR